MVAVAVFFDFAKRLAGVLDQNFVKAVADFQDVFGPDFNVAGLAFGAASAMVMFLAVMALIIPYLYSELKGTRNA